MSIRVTDYQPVFADPSYYCGPGPALIVGDDGAENITGFLYGPEHNIIGD